MRRLTILLAAVGALMLVPAAQALANGFVFATGAGTGSGEVTSVGGLPFAGGAFEGEPPLECAYDGETEESSGTCATEMETTEEGNEALGLTAIPSEGFEFGGWSPNVTCYLFPNILTNCAVGNEGGELGENQFVTAEFVPCEEGSEEPTCEEAATEFPLTLNINEGEGTVVSDPAGLECTGPEGEECTSEFEEGTEVTLTASPAAGYRFYTWQNCPPEGYNDRQCTVTMDEAKEVGVKFRKTSSLTASKAEGSEPGIIKSDPGGAICFFPCDSATLNYDEGTEVTLFAKAPNHRHFVEFTGGTGQAEACNGETSCTYTTDGTDSSVEALFERDEQATLSIDKEGGGQARIKIQPSNVLCVYTCAATTADFYTEPEAETATVEWKLKAGTSSIDWGTGAGTCTGSSEEAEGECEVTMSAATELTATLE